MPDPEDRTLTAADGVFLAGRVFAPAAACRGAALVAPAMAVPQSFYEPFARWLGEQGILALTFDPRGVGRSRRGHLRDERADVLTWAELDCAAALGALAERADSLPVNWIGHSLGGQILPFVPGRERAVKVVTVACGSGYWRDNVPRHRRRAWVLWWVIAPISLALLGYYPGRRLRLLGDLPPAAMAQWRRWCLDPEYAVGVEGERARALYAAVRTPITSLSFTDDEYLSARNIEALHQQYTGAPRRMLRISPAERGLSRIGHLGFFRPGQERLWQDLVLPELALAR
jgi:predicted alpha/beta hydrolase